jgi:hypothetical protein
MALSVVTDSSEIPTGRVGQEYIGTGVQPSLSTSLESAPESRQLLLFQFRIGRDGHKNVRVFGASLVGKQRPEYGDATDPVRPPSTQHEIASQLEECGTHLCGRPRSVLPLIWGMGS